MEYGTKVGGDVAGHRMWVVVGGGSKTDPGKIVAVYLGSYGNTRQKLREFLGDT